METIAKIEQFQPIEFAFECFIDKKDFKEFPHESQVFNIIGGQFIFAEYGLN